MDDRTVLRVKTYKNNGKWHVEIIGGTSGLGTGSQLNPDNGFFQNPHIISCHGFSSRTAARTALHSYMAQCITWLKVIGGLH